MLSVLRRHYRLLSTCILLSLLSISIIFLHPFLELPIPHKSIEHVRNDVQIHRRRGLFPVDFPARIVCAMDEGCSMRRPLRWHGPRRCWNRKVRGWMCRRHGVRVDRRICVVGARGDAHEEGRKMLDARLGSERVEQKDCYLRALIIGVQNTMLPARGWPLRSGASGVARSECMHGGKRTPARCAGSMTAKYARK